MKSGDWLNRRPPHQPQHIHTHQPHHVNPQRIESTSSNKNHTPAHTDTHNHFSHHLPSTTSPSPSPHPFTLFPPSIQPNPHPHLITINIHMSYSSTIPSSRYETQSGHNNSPIHQHDLITALLSATPDKIQATTMFHSLIQPHTHHLCPPIIQHIIQL